MQRNLLAITFTLILAFFTQVGSSGAQDVDSFDSNASSATSSDDSKENSTSSYDDILNAFSALADGLSSGLSDVVSQVKNFDVAAFLNEHPEFIREVIYGVIGVSFLAFVFYVVVILPIRFLRWLLGGGKKDEEKRGKDERIYVNVVPGKESRKPYAFHYQDVTERIKRERLSAGIWGMIASFFVFSVIAFFVFVLIIYPMCRQ